MTPALRTRDRPADDEQPYVSDESLLLRSYDDESRTVTVRVFAGDDLAFERTYTLPPLSVVGVPLRLDRAVYRVDARIDDHDDSAECLIGSAPTETALIEVGNGLIGVSEGMY